MFRNTGSSLLRAPYDKDMDNTKINQASESIQQTNQPAAQILPLLPTPTNAHTQCHEATTSAAASKHAEECEICKCGFSRKDSMHRHCLNVHGVNIIQKKKDKQTQLVKTAHPFNFTSDIDDGMFICPQCGVPFISKSARDQHIHMIFPIFCPPPPPPPNFTLRQTRLGRPLLVWFPG